MGHRRRAWGDNQPQFTLGGEHVAGVEAGAQQDLSLPRHAEDGDAVPGQARVDAGRAADSLMLELVGPLVAYDLEGRKHLAGGTGRQSRERSPA